MNNANKILIYRGLTKLIHQPAAPLTGFGMSLFFLIVYNAGIGGIGHLQEFGQGGYLAFIFPLTIVSLAMGSASGSVQLLHADIQSGYFKRLYLSPVNRLMLVVAPLLADILSTTIFTIVLMIIGYIFGMPFQAGIFSALGILVFSLLWAITLSGFSAGIMLRTGDHKSAQIVTTAVFPLLFLSTTFLPRELITAKWLVTVSWANPVTYVLEANRYLLAGTSSVKFFIIGIIVLSVSATVSLLFALLSSRKILV